MRNALLATLVALAVVFGLQNIHPASMTFIIWHVETALAFALLGAFLLGAAVGALLVLPWGMRARREARGAQRRMAELERDLPHHPGAAPGITTTPTTRDPHGSA